MSSELLLFAHANQLNEATTHYIGTLARAAEALGLRLRHAQHLSEVPRKAQVLVVECKSAFKLWLMRPQVQTWLWMQGIYPEEARLQFNSRAREAWQNQFESRALRSVRGVVMVSEAMRLHIARKYPHLHLDRFVMPCANAELQPEAFMRAARYEQPSFVYAGSLHAWQCFDLTLEVYRLVKATYPAASLHVFTGSQEAARKQLRAFGLDDVRVERVPLSQLQDRLAEFKYGFVLRRPHVVNEVSTPTKVSSYMAAGVIPVMTTAVHDYARQLSGVSPLVISEGFEPHEIAAAILRQEQQAVRPQQMLQSYEHLFERYFSHDRYLPGLRGFLERTGMRGD